MQEPTPRSFFPSWLQNILTGPVLGFFGVLVLFVILIGTREGKGELAYFLSLRNLQVTVNEITITAIIALGSLLIIISGGIDLSVGSVTALVAVVTMKMYTSVYETSGGDVATASLVAIPVGVLAGGLCGFVNGIVVTGLRVSPFVATLGMMSVARGLALLLAGRTDLAFPGGKPTWAKMFQQVHPSTIFNPSFWSLAVLAVLILLVLRLTVFGRYVYAIGSNEATARLCGVPVDRTKIAIYTLAGMLTGWAGVLSFTNVGGSPTSSQGLELEVIAAIVIGGASLAGGIGTVEGTLLGVLLLGLLLNGVRSLRVPIDSRLILIGIVIVVSTALGRARSAWRGESA